MREHLVGSHGFVLSQFQSLLSAAIVHDCGLTVPIHGGGRVALFHASHTREHPLCAELAPHLKVLGDRHAVLNVVPTLRAHAFDPLANCHYFVCGPPDMMRAVLEHLHTSGVSADHVHYEAFGPRPHRPEPQQ